MRPHAVAVAVVTLGGWRAPAAPALAEELPIAVQTERLDNGLRVVLSPDHTSPTVAIEVYYDAGSRVEEPGRAGLAHLFEHMMFEGSANVGRGEHFRLVTARGGTFNGRTNPERARYSDFLPAAELALGLFLEADRMRALSVTSETFEAQRLVVLEERRQSYENRPYMLSYLRRDALAYGAYFPYAHSTLGDVADLQRVTLDEARAFYDRHYTPDRAVLAIAGDFEPVAAMALVRRHFGPLTAGAAPPWREPTFEPQRAERRETFPDPLAQAPAFHLAWHIPPRRSPDHYALDVLAVVLGGGRSARLYRELVRERELASVVEVDTEGHRGPDLFTVWCVLAAGHTGEEARAVIDGQLADIARDGVTARELTKAHNLLRRQFVFGLQSYLLRARYLAEYALFDGDASLLRTELDRYLAVTADDVRRVAGAYFARENRTVLDVLPAPARAAGAGGGG